MSKTRKILFVDNDVNLRSFLLEQMLLHDEFTVTGVDDLLSAVAAIQSNTTDLLIINTTSSDGNGHGAVKILRENGFKRPIILLVDFKANTQSSLSLETGPTDYVLKPFRFSVLLKRVRTYLRQHEGSEDAVFALGPYSFRPGAKLLLTEKGAKLRLTEKETAILHYLYRAGDKAVSRDILLQEVWGYNAHVTTHTLETHIYRLRQKIEINPAIAQLLVTDDGGYRLVP